VAGVLTGLLDPERVEAFDAANRVEQKRLRDQHADREKRPLVPIGTARAHREVVSFDDLPVPAFTGLREVSPDLRALREMIDWRFFFIAWELKGNYPAILEEPVARELYDEAQVLLDRIEAEKLLQARGVYGFWPAHSEGDDIVFDGGPRFPMLRQQRQDSRPARCLADYVAPEGDHLGAFAVSIQGAEELAAEFEAQQDDYKAIMVKSLADRLAEAFAEWVHLKARREWYEPDADPDLDDLHHERFRGIRPAFGYPASPDHTQKGPQFDLLEAGSIGMKLTENFAMTPAASVSALFFAHPDARYFAVGRIGEDQVREYAQRAGIPVADAERILRPNLGYEPKER
jgi:5-methyltetrahydrofolate--homocysteine methyltransferase